MEYPPDKPILLKQLADDLGFHPSSVRKAIVRRGLVPFRLSDEPNKPLYLKGSDAEAFKKQIESERDNTFHPHPGRLAGRVSGVYFIEVPSYDGAVRIKIGWSENFTERYATYRTIVPDLRIKGFWPTSDAWSERAALKCAEHIGRRLHHELFEFADSQKALESISELFAKLGMQNKVFDIVIRNDTEQTAET
ncbi:MAG: GIY-YIG nuclease family protein [Verrucomicrobiae bacterium]|nr:GIY-YIG nuclease family protein [Verrucomicrobiae bacterium]